MSSLPTGQHQLPLGEHDVDNVTRLHLGAFLAHQPHLLPINIPIDHDIGIGATATAQLSCSAPQSQMLEVELLFGRNQLFEMAELVRVIAAFADVLPRRFRVLGRLSGMSSVRDQG